MRNCIKGHSLGKVKNHYVRGSVDGLGVFYSLVWLPYNEIHFPLPVLSSPLD